MSPNRMFAATEGLFNGYHRCGRTRVVDIWGQIRVSIVKAAREPIYVGMALRKHVRATPLPLRRPFADPVLLPPKIRQCYARCTPVMFVWLGLTGISNGLAFAIGMLGMSLAVGAVRLAQRWAANPKLPSRPRPERLLT